MRADRGLLVGVALVLEGWALMLAGFLVVKLVVAGWSGGNPLTEGVKVALGLLILLGALAGWYLSGREIVVRMKRSGRRRRA